MVPSCVANISSSGSQIPESNTGFPPFTPGMKSTNRSEWLNPDCYNNNNNNDNNNNNNNNNICRLASLYPQEPTNEVI